MNVRFGKFVFDEPSRELAAGGRNVPRSPKAFELLGVLLRARPRALSKAELRDRLWPDTFVGETSLPRVVGEIRRALGDRAGEARFVRTVQRSGYAFVADAVDGGGGRGSARGGGPETGCALLWGDRLFPLVVGENIVGRDPEAALTIPSGLVSRRRAASSSPPNGPPRRISAAGTGPFAKDGGSRERWTSPTGTRSGSAPRSSSSARPTQDRRGPAGKWRRGPRTLGARGSGRSDLDGS